MFKKNLLLNEREIILKIRRIAYEIAENHYKTKKIIFCSVGKTGITFLELLIEELNKIFTNSFQFISYNESKKKFYFEKKEFTNFENQAIIMTDDVMNTGKSIANCFSQLLPFSPKLIEIAVIIYRQHTLFPFSPTYAGVALKTVLENNIKIELEKKKMGAYLYDN